MRFLGTLLIGLVVAASMSAAQSLPNRGGGGWNKPGGPSIGPKGPSIGPRGPGIGPGGPSIIIGPTIGRSCPRGTVGKWPACISVDTKKCPANTTGKWPDCKPKSTASCAQKDMIGKWPNCREPEQKRCPKGTAGTWPDCIDIAQPSDKACPEGQIRKGKSCIQVTEGGSGKTTPPKAKAKKQTPIPPAIAALTAARPHRPREVLVLVDAARADEISARLAREYNVTAEPGVALALLDGVIVRLRLERGQSLDTLLAGLSADADVELAQPNYDYRVSQKTTSPPAAPQYAGQTIRLEEAHRSARGKGVKIAVIDTAIDTGHPELVDAIAGMFDAVGSGPAPAEPHGTEIAGILAARDKLTGVAPDAKLLSVRAFSGGKAKPAQSSSLQLLKGIDWAFSSGAKIMNMSFAGPMDPLLDRIIKTASAKGVIFIAAAGNNGPKAPPAYPAAYPDVIAVTATDEDDKLYAKANQGDYISVAAPGVDIVVPALMGHYGLASGTSMAAAHVSGVAALLLEGQAALSAAEIRAILASSARQPVKTLSKEAIGAGIVDAAGAVAYPGQSGTGEDRPSGSVISAEP
jgi:subtilisin family serine protease